MEQGAGPLVLSIAMLAVFALAAGGLWLVAKRRDRKRGVLMLAAAAVLVGNVLVWTWPIGDQPRASDSRRSR